MPSTKQNGSKAEDNKLLQERKKASLPKTAFTSETAKKANALANTPEAKAKAAETRHANTLIRHAIYDKLKQDLLQENKAGVAYFQTFLDSYLKEAKAHPNSKAGTTVASVIFKDDLLQLLDEQQEKMMLRDLDFARYRAIKRLFKEQRDVVLDTDKRKKCVICSRRAGKTDANSTSIVYTAITPNSPILYINKTFTNAINQMWDLVKEQAEAVGLNTAEGTSKSQGVMIFNNGSFVIFSGNANEAEADKLRGGKYRLIIIDEAGHQGNMRYLVDEVLGPCLMDYDDSQLVLTGTPPRIPHTYVEKCWNSGEFETYHWTMHRNPYIHNVDEEIARICKEKGLIPESPFIQREYFGKMGIYDTEAMVFGGRQTYVSLEEDDQGRYELPFKPTNIVLGVDFGYVDNNAVVTLAYNKYDRQAIVLPNEDVFNKSSVSEIIEAVQKQLKVAKDLAIKYDIDLSRVEVFCDNNEKSIVSEMARSYNINAHTCWKYNKAMAISQLAEELRTGRMKIQEHGAMDNEMDQILYKRDETTDAILPELDENIGIHPDCMFALLYASRQMMLDYGYEMGGRSKDEEL